jgi:hypothetical protein
MSQLATLTDNHILKPEYYDRIAFYHIILNSDALAIVSSLLRRQQWFDHGQKSNNRMQALVLRQQ